MGAQLFHADGLEISSRFSQFCERAKNSTFCPQSAYLRQATTVSVQNINWRVFITETVCVYCAVRIKSLNISLQAVPGQRLFRRHFDSDDSVHCDICRRL